VKYTKNSS